MLKRIELGRVYEHKKTKKHYVTLEWCKFKDPFCREWIDCVSYVPVDKTNVAEPYVRTLDDFADRFRLVKGDK